MWVYERKLAQSKVTKRWLPINCKQLKDHKFLQPTFFTQNLSFSSHSWILLLGVYYSWHVCQIQLNFWWTKTKSAFLCTDHHRSVSLEKPVCRKRFRLTRPTKCPFSTANANNLSDFRLFVQNACENVSWQQTRTICPFLVCAKRLRKRRSSTKICYLRISSPQEVNHEKECRVRNNFLCTPVWVEGCLLGCLVCARAMARKNWKARKFSVTRWFDYFLKIWPFARMEISTIMSQICQSRLGILPNKKLTIKNLPKNCKLLPKLRNFDKSGHTSGNWQ